MKRLLFLICSITLALTAIAQSCPRITLITCSPGTELYSTFGHTALRVKDSTNNTDLVFNYGTFEFAPDFYTKFILGKLRYALSVERFEDFLYTYQEEKRWVAEQEVLLDCNSKQQLFSALRTNALEENRYYRYDFLFDNCTTRAKEMIKASAGAPVQLRNIIAATNPTFRNLIHEYLNRGKQPWSKAGIDFLLGVRLDRKATNEEAMFLPEKLMLGLDSATIKEQYLVGPSKIIYQPQAPAPEGPLFTPFVIFAILFLIIAALGFVQNRAAKRILAFFDFAFFLILGLSGALLLFMWFGTDHTVCAYNFNLLWANPVYLFGAFLLLRRRPATASFFRIVLFWSLALALAWWILPQQMNPAFYPLLLLTLLRSWIISNGPIYARIQHPAQRK